MRTVTFNFNTDVTTDLYYYEDDLILVVSDAPYTPEVGGHIRIHGANYIIEDIIYQPEIFQTEIILK